MECPTCRLQFLWISSNFNQFQQINFNQFQDSKLEILGGCRKLPAVSLGLGLGPDPGPETAGSFLQSSGPGSGPNQFGDPKLEAQAQRLQEASCSISGLRPVPRPKPRDCRKLPASIWAWAVAELQSYSSCNTLALRTPTCTSCTRNCTFNEDRCNGKSSCSPVPIM